MACSSQAGLDVTTCWGARLRLSVDSGEGDVWGQRLHAAAQCLSTRGTLPTSLTLQCTHSSTTPALLAAVPPALQGAGAGVTELAVVFPANPLLEFLGSFRNHARKSVTQFLQQIAPALPSLSSLSLQRCLCTFASPPALSSLTALSLMLPDTSSALYSELLISAGPYLSQLSRLEITTTKSAHAWVHIPWPYLFVTATTTHTLTHLTTSDWLSDDLLSMLLVGAPALQCITVDSVSVREDHSNRQWAVKQLSVTAQQHVGLDTLVCLPRSTADRLQIVGVTETSVSMNLWHQVSSRNTRQSQHLMYAAVFHSCICPRTALCACVCARTRVRACACGI